jgi:hypothetical protein
MTNIRTIRQNDPDFQMQDGFVLVPRAHLHIMPDCPLEYRRMITIAVDQGWLKPVANVRDNELMWETLSQ